MALTTGTISNYGEEFHFPSGTIIYAVQVIGKPEYAMGERNITNHGNGGYEERAPNGLLAASDFTLSLIATPGNVSLITDQAAKTERVCYIKGKQFGYLFTGWIKSVKEEDADASSPDSVKLTVVVTPRGQLTIAAI
jgi:hypothetical protein